MGDLPPNLEEASKDPLLGIAVGYLCPVCDYDTAKILNYEHIDNRPWGLQLQCKLCHYEWWYGYFEENIHGSPDTEDN